MNIKQISPSSFCCKDGQLYYLINTYPFKIFQFKNYQDLHNLNKNLGALKSFITPVDCPNYFSLELIFSTACNLACTYCYAREKKTGCYNMRPQNMDKTTIKKAIDFSLSQLINNLKKNKSDRGTFDLYFMGGEPLLNKKNLFFAMDYIMDQVKKIKEKFNLTIKVSPVISTNGILINEEVAVFFKKFKFSYVGVTIDGEKHDNYRKFPNGKGTLSEILKGIKFLIKNKVNLKILSVVPPGEVNKIDKILAFFDSLKILSNATRVSIVPRAPAINEMYRTCAIPQPYIKKILKKTKGNKFSKKERKIFAQKLLQITKEYNIDERDLKRKIIELVKMGGSLYHCPAALWKISISPDGSIYPCHQFVGIKKFYMGNILQNINPAQSSDYKKIEKMFKKRTVFKINKCKKCLFQTICPPLVDCPARSFLEENSFYKTPQYCEIYFPYIKQTFINFLNNL